MSKIEEMSYRFSLLFKALIVLYPILVAIVWLGGIIPFASSSFITTRFPDIELSSVRFGLRFYACLIDMIPTAIDMLSFYYLAKLFQLYSRRIIFSYQNVRYIRKIGFTLLWSVFAYLLVQPILSIILTWDAPQGGHMVTLGFGSDDLSNLIIGGVVVLISWIMEEGRKLEEETALTV